MHPGALATGTLPHNIIWRCMSVTTASVRAEYELHERRNRRSSTWSGTPSCDTRGHCSSWSHREGKSSHNSERNSRTSGFESWISTPYRPWCSAVRFVFDKLRDKYLRLSFDSPSCVCVKTWEFQNVQSLFIEDNALIPLRRIWAVSSKHFPPQFMDSIHTNHHWDSLQEGGSKVVSRCEAKNQSVV